MDTESIECLAQIQDNGEQQYIFFIEERLHSVKKPISDPIHRNKLVLFNKMPPKKISKAAQASSLIKDDANTFAQLYIACQTRDGDINIFFKHENHDFPPSLSYGALQKSNTADLIGCLEKKCTVQQRRPQTDVTILDGAAVINFLQPGSSKTFQDYTMNIFIPYIEYQRQT